MEFIYKRKINYYETDRMGIVHHSNYIRFLEEARCAWLEYYNLPFAYIEEQGITIPVLEVECKYKNHVTLGDTITIKPIVSKFNGIRMEIIYEVLEEKTKEIIIEATTKHCFTDRNLRPINLKKHNQEIFEVFEKM